MRKLLITIIFLIVLAVCLPAQAQGPNSILVYNLSVKSWSASGSGTSWSSSSSRNKGHVLLDVSHDPNGLINGVNSALKIATYRSGGSKYYSETSKDFDVANVIDPNSNTSAFAIVNLESGSGQLTMLRGNVRRTNIGNDDPNNVAPVLNGDLLGYMENGSTSISTNQWTWRLNQSWTRNANQNGQTITQVRNMIRQRYRERNYTGVPEEEE